MKTAHQGIISGDLMMKDTDIKSIDSKEFFVEFLKTEIDQLQEKMKTPGWTIWAIGAAGASVVWLLVLEIEKKAFDVDQTLLLFLLLSYVVGILRIILSFFKPKDKKKRNQYLNLDAIVSGNRYSSLYTAVFSIVLILLVLHFSINVNTFTTYSALVCNAALIVVPVGLFGLMRFARKFLHTNLYVPNFMTDLERNTNSKGVFWSRNKVLIRSILIPGILFLFVLWFVSYGLYYVNDYGMEITATISSFKIAILAISIPILIELLIGEELSSPTLKNLIDIRRDLIFDNISLDIARDLAEVAIYGLDKSSMIQTEVSGCISTLQAIDTELNSAIKKNEVATNLLSETKNQPTEAAMISWQSLRDASLSNFRQAREIYLSDERLEHGLEAFCGYIA